MAPLFSWVHLSDIHFGHGTPMQVWDQRAIVLAMRADIAKVAGSSYPRPDALLVTGDIAFSGGSVTRPGPSSLPEYEEARQWLTKLLADLALPPERAFCIPGNHDVQRAVDQADRNVKRLVDALRSGLDRIDSVWAYPDDEVLLRKRQANYLAFAKGFGVQTSDLFWSHTLKAAAGLDVRLIGLNTSLLCADDADSDHGTCDAESESEGADDSGTDDVDDGLDDAGDAVADHNFPADGCSDDDATESEGSDGSGSDD